MLEIYWKQKYKLLKNTHKTFLNAEGDHDIATTASTEGRINRNTYELACHTHLTAKYLPMYIKHIYYLRQPINLY